LGGVAVIANSAGAADVDESFTALGVRRNPTNPNAWTLPASASDLTTIANYSREGYTFQTALGQSLGLNHLNGRIEDAITGRFLSPDPMVQDPTNAQNYNRFSYVLNNPLTLIDPSGFCWKTIPTDTMTPGPDGTPIETFSDDYEWYNCTTPAQIPPWPYIPPSIGHTNGTSQLAELSVVVNIDPCSAWQHAAASLAKNMSILSNQAGFYAIGTGTLTIIAGFGEAPSFGADTPFTAALGASTLYFTDMSMGADIAADALDAYASGDFNGYQQSTVGLIETNAVSFLAKRAGVPSAMASKAGDAWGLYIGFVAQAPSSCH
jgi:RHS repeat-associated protein